MWSIKMGMYDQIKYNCFWCGKKNYAQTKVFGSGMLVVFVVGDELYVDDDERLANCIINLKNKCEKCEKETAIVIRKGKYIGIDNPINANCSEKHWGNIEWEDELTEMMKEKLRRIKNGNKKENRANRKESCEK